MLAAITSILLCLCESSLSNTLEGELVLSHVLFRHGDRTPIDPFPTDPWADLKYWPVEWGQLTNTGKLQQYNLGKWLRSRYDSVLNETYSLEEIYIRSTDVDRTLMSALANLAGLYPPIGNQVWNKDIVWQPVPVHTEPEEEDNILRGTKPCPAYESELLNVKNSKEVKDLNKRFQSLFSYLAEHTGRKISNLDDAGRIYDVLFIESLYNKTLPHWAKEVYPGDLVWVSAKSFEIPTFTRKLARLKIGPLIEEMFNRFTLKSTNKLKPNRSLWIYSGHDVTVANLLNGLKLFETHNPPYAACVLLELRILNQQPFISIFYKNTTEDPSALYIPKCGIMCPLSKMIELYSDILPKNWEAECRKPQFLLISEDLNINFTTGVILISLMVMFSFIVMYGLFALYKKQIYMNYHNNSRTRKSLI